MLYLASDHGGFKLKEHLKKILKKKRISFEDLGPQIFNPGDDYPEFAKRVAIQVSKNPSANTGILMCRSGQGMNIVANKFKGIRAALCWNPEVAAAAKNDENVNILCLPSDYISEEHAEEILAAWLNTPFSVEPRFQRRLDEINVIEKS